MSRTIDDKLTGPIANWLDGAHVIRFYEAVNDGSVKLVYAGEHLYCRDPLDEFVWLRNAFQRAYRLCL